MRNIHFPLSVFLHALFHAQGGLGNEPQGEAFLSVHLLNVLQRKERKE